MNKYKESLEYIIGFIPKLTSPRNGKKILIESINSIQELIDKATPKKVVLDELYGLNLCPNCGSINIDYGYLDDLDNLVEIRLE